MLRNCPKCGDYYADNLLAFCLADGTPLVNVDPHGKSWSEGKRVVEEKENALRKQKRGRKWRRVGLSAATMLVATMLVCVMVVNSSYVYLEPEPDKGVLVEPQTPATAPASLRPSPCSDDDKSRAKESIIQRFGDDWRRKIEGERRRIISENVPDGAVEVEATLGALEYVSTFLRGCQEGVITVRYVWEVSANVNGTTKVLTVARAKKFTCLKVVGAWLCS
jgi:hypothetical protein